MKTSKLLIAVVAVASTLFIALSARAEFTCELSFPSAPATALANFPVLVRLAEDAPTGFSYADCPELDCLWFTDENDDAIPCDVDTWDTTGESLVWVSVPSLSDAATITMHWDASGAPSGLPASSQVWSLANYVGVWHMNEILEETSTGKHYTPDSSASGWNAYKANEADGYPVTISDAGNATSAPPTGHAMVNQLGGNRNIGGFLVPASATSGTTIGPFTVSFFEECTSTGNDRAVAFGSSHTEGCVTAAKSNTYVMAPGGFNTFDYSDGLADNAWRHIAGVFDTNLAGYVGGAYRNLNKNVGNKYSITLTKGIGLGTFTTQGETFTGYLDEARIRNVASTADWIAEEYKTVTTANYVTFGDVEGGGATVELLRIGTPTVSDITAVSATVAGRLTKLGEGATSASVSLHYTDGGAVTNTVALGSTNAVPAVFTAALANLTPSTAYTVWFSAVNNAETPASTNSVAVVFSTCAVERMLTYTKDMVVNYSSNKDPSVWVVRLQDGQIFNDDAANSLTIDFGATYRITKIVYAGRNDSACNTRMQKVSFSSSVDKTSYTVFHTVPDTFIQGAELITNDLTSASVEARWFKVENVANGSITELQFWSDTDAIKISTPEIYNETSSGATASVSVTLDGNFASGATVALKAYVAASDLGNDVAAWQSGATEIDCGSVAVGGSWTGTLAAANPGGVNYVRFYATARNANSEDVSEFLEVASTFMAVSFVENRPLVESSASMLVHYPGTIAETYKAFDNDDTTVPSSGSGYMGALDYGRPVRIDRVRIVTSGANSVGIPIQVSQDGWTWDTIASRASTADLAVNIDLATPVVARYLRFGGDGKTQTTPQINEVRTYALDGEAFVALTGETSTHTAAGLVVSGTIAATGLASGAKVDLYGYVGQQDYGLKKSDWDVAGIAPTYIGQFSVGASFTTPALTGTANATSGVRYGAVVAVATGAASSMGTAHPFTLNNETLLDITEEMVVTNYYAPRNTSNDLAKLFQQGFWGNRSVITASGDNYSNGAVSFGGKQYRITMVEWHDRLDGQCLDRARVAKFRIYNSESIIGSTDYTQIASASSAWGASTYTVHCNRWNAVAPAEKAVGYGVGIYDADHGNGFFRFWGYKDTGRGFSIYVR